LGLFDNPADYLAHSAKNWYLEPFPNLMFWKILFFLEIFVAFITEIVIYYNYQGLQRLHRGF
jgi:ABC-type multidrug transport system permease subunit